MSPIIIKLSARTVSRICPRAAALIMAPRELSCHWSLKRMTFQISKRAIMALWFYFSWSQFKKGVNSLPHKYRRTKTWPPAHPQQEDKVSLLTLQCITGCGPTQLRELFTPQTSAHSLRSENRHQNCFPEVRPAQQQSEPSALRPLATLTTF